MFDVRLSRVEDNDSTKERTESFALKAGSGGPCLTDPVSVLFPAGLRILRKCESHLLGIVEIRCTLPKIAPSYGRPCSPDPFKIGRVVITVEAVILFGPQTKSRRFSIQARRHDKPEAGLKIVEVVFHRKLVGDSVQLARMVWPNSLKNEPVPAKDGQ